MSPPSPPRTSLSKTQAIIAQLEFYLSPTNLPYDQHLNAHIIPPHWFPLSIIATYPRMQTLQATNPTLLAALLRTYSSLITVHPNDQLITPNWLMKTSSAPPQLLLQPFSPCACTIPPPQNGPPLFYFPVFRMLPAPTPCMQQLVSQSAIHGAEMRRNISANESFGHARARFSSGRKRVSTAQRASQRKDARNAMHVKKTHVQVALDKGGKQVKGKKERKVEGESSGEGGKGVQNAQSLRDAGKEGEVAEGEGSIARDTADHADIDMKTGVVKCGTVDGTTGPVGTLDVESGGKEQGEGDEKENNVDLEGRSPLNTSRKV